MPAALYKLVRNEGATNPNPIVISGRKVRTTSKQIQKPFLCQDCEDRLSKFGERIVIPNCARIESFPLLEKLRAANPLVSGPDLAAYDLRDILSDEADCFHYFAASIFWRASATAWYDESRKLDLIRLGKYDLPVRHFLLGQRKLPDQVAIVMIVMTNTPREFITVPDTARHGLYHHHQFCIPGITFSAFVGNALPDEVRRLRMDRKEAAIVVCGSMADAGANRWLETSAPTLELSQKLRKKYGR